MTSSSGSLPPTHPLYDLLLRLAPSDLLLFDTALICQYAAPVEDDFFGQPREQLTGRHVAEILPPAADGLGPILERAAREASPWRDPDYPFIFRLDDAETPYRWSLRIEPIEAEDYRGVLVILHDIRELAERYDQTQAELDELRRREEERTRNLRDLRAHLRSLLAPISAYLQVIARRPEVLAGRSAASVVEESILPEIDALVTAIDRLDDEASPGT